MISSSRIRLSAAGWELIGAQSPLPQNWGRGQPRGGRPLTIPATSMNPAAPAGVRGLPALALTLALAACDPGAPPGQAPLVETPSEPAPASTDAGERQGAAPATDGATDSATDGASDIETALRFEEWAAQAGIDFEHAAGYTPNRYAPEIMGPGVAVLDVDRDGDPDLYVTNGGEVGAQSRPDGMGDRLYLNDGRGGFVDATEEWGLVPTHYGMGVAAGDIDGDGWTDLYLTSFGGGERLLRNTGSSFEDITEASGIDNAGAWSTSAGFFDLDLDGDLDLLVVNYTDYSLDEALPCYANDVHVYCTPELYAGQPNVIWINDGQGRFRPSAAVAEPPDSPPTRGLALALGDIDLDGDVDIYVANDLDRNELWLNNGAGGLTEVGRLRGVAYSATGVEEAGMGTDITDMDMDGRPDVASANFQGETLSMYRQGEGLLFTEVSDAIGVGTAARARLSWGLDFFDADNDGDEDLIVANGHLYDNVETFSADEGFAQPNTLFENGGDGAFVDVTSAAGPALADRQSSRGLATGDLDGDGRLDIVIGNNGGTLQILRNATEPAGHWVGLWLEGVGPRTNRSAIGARVVARLGGDGSGDAGAGAERVIERQIYGASSYLSVNDRRVHVGLGDAEVIDTLEIHWPGAEVQTLSGLAVDAWYYVAQGSPPVRFVPGEAVVPPEGPTP